MNEPRCDPTATASDDQTGPLAGLTIVGLEQAVSAPICTRVLADFGARVIKIENPRGGDFARDYDEVVNGPNRLAAHFVWENRGKQSVSVNLKTAAGMEILHQLLHRADALVSNLAPGALARMKLSAAELRVRHPHLITLEIDGYGGGGRCPTSAPTTCWCRPRPEPARSPAIRACRPSPALRSRISRLDFMARCRS